MRQRRLLPSIEAIGSSPRSRWIAVLLIASAILVVSVIPIPGAVPEEGGGVPTSAPFHFVGYAVLATLLGFALLARRRALSANTLALVGASLYGVLIEFVQYPIPYRSFSYLDMLINTAGAFFGVLLLALLLARSEQGSETAAADR